jgi:polyphosphate:AMP phosphotransferase
MPPHGRIGVFFDSWYTQPMDQRFRGRIDDDTLDAALQHVRAFEEGLADNGTLLLKFWLHLSKAAQKEHVKKLERDPNLRWRVRPIDRLQVKRYDEFRMIAERTLRETSSIKTPWTIVNATDVRHCYVAVGQHLAEALGHRLDAPKPQPLPTPSPAGATAAPRVSILDQLDLTQCLEKDAYDRKLARCQGRLNRLTRKAYRQRQTSVLVFEGWDASGKGGAVRKLADGMDPRDYTIVPVGAPSDEEKAHHYLWRFWRRLPRAGKVIIFDRSWYGRVLVERVEGFAGPDEWQRAYREINDFEAQLHERGYLLMKFWLHIDRDEQLRRFQGRENTPFKNFKITEEDWRNRDKWPLYDAAVNDMVERCSTEYAPWTLVEANDKYFARIKILKLFCKELAKRL